MGTILIKIPKEIELEYELNNSEETEKLFRKLGEINFSPKTRKPDPLLGLFSDDAEMLDRITEEALESREKHPLRIRP